MDEQLPPPPAEIPRPGIASGPPGSSSPITPVNPASQNAALMLVIGGILVVIGGMLPVLSVTGPGGFTTTVPGTEAGFGVILLGGLAVVKGVSALRRSALRSRLGSPLVTAVVLAALLVWRWNDIRDAISQVEAVAPGITASAGVGFWLDVAGVILIGVAGLLGRRADRAI
jgi:hypothetical protein